MPNDDAEFVDKIEFRFRKDERQDAIRLANMAKAKKCTIGELARELVKAGLNKSDRLEYGVETVLQELAQLSKQVRELASMKTAVDAAHETVYEVRDDLLTCVVKLLADAGRLTPPKAEQWAKTTFDI